KAYATDLGPGNTLMNQFMKAHFGVEMDKDATTAKKGSVHNGLLEQLLYEEFLSLDFPKTTGPELFNLSYLRKAQQKSGTLELSAQNVMATLNGFSAQAIVNAIQKQSAGLDNVAVYISGGGLHNPLLVDHIKGKLG